MGQGSNALDWCITHKLHYVKCTVLVHSVEDAFALACPYPRLSRPCAWGRGSAGASRGEGWEGGQGVDWVGEGEIGWLRKFVYRSIRNFTKFLKRVVILITIDPPACSIFVIGTHYFIVIRTDYCVVMRVNNKIVLSLKIFIFGAALSRSLD